MYTCLSFTLFFFFFFKQKTAYEMRISDWSSDVCSSDLASATAMVPSFLGAIGSHKHFKTYTIDQSAKSISLGRIGMWNAPRHQIGRASCRERVCQYV